MLSSNIMNLSNFLLGQGSVLIYSFHTSETCINILTQLFFHNCPYQKILYTYYAYILQFILSSSFKSRFTIAICSLLTFFLCSSNIKTVFFPLENKIGYLLYVVVINISHYFGKSIINVNTRPTLSMEQDSFLVIIDCKIHYTDIEEQEELPYDYNDTTNIRRIINNQPAKMTL